MALQDLDKGLGLCRLYQAAVTQSYESNAVQGLQMDERLDEGMHLATWMLLCDGVKRMPVLYINMQLPSSPGE